DGVAARAMVQKGIHQRGVVTLIVGNFQIALNRAGRTSPSLLRSTPPGSGREAGISNSRTGG
ncbi:MAG TPA: hypothetical protein VII18_17360, partial [Mycobacterium sp.]